MVPVSRRKPRDFCTATKTLLNSSGHQALHLWHFISSWPSSSSSKSPDLAASRDALAFLGDRPKTSQDESETKRYHRLACRWVAPLLPAVAAPSTATVSTGRCRTRDRMGRLRHSFKQGLTFIMQGVSTPGRISLQPSKHPENLLVSSWAEEQRQHSHLRRENFLPGA